MPKNLLTYRCLIISPSDVAAEREVISRTIETWNAQTGPTLDARIDPVRWEKNAAPEMGDRAQAILNRQMVDNVDFAIAVFHTRVGTPTGEHESGSLEEIDRLQRRGARVLVYFSEKPLPADVNLDQLKRLRDAREKLQKEGLVGTFDSTEGLGGIVQGHITMVMGELVARDRSSNQAARIGVSAAQQPDVRVSMRVVRAVPVMTSHPRSEITYLQVRVENHSPSTVFLTGLSFDLGEGVEGTSERDSYGREVHNKRPVESGDSTDYLFTPDAIRSIAGDNTPIGAIAHDAIQRRFRGGLDLPKLLVEAERAQAAERVRDEQARRHEQFVSANEDWLSQGWPGVAEESRSGPSDDPRDEGLYILREASGRELGAYRIAPGFRDRVRPLRPPQGVS